MIRILTALLVLLPLTAHADKDERTRGRYQGVATSIDGPFVAKWTIDHLSFSADRGKTFTGVLSGKDILRVVAVDRDGTLYAVRGNALGVRSPDGRERWTTLPRGVYWDSITVAGPNVVLDGVLWMVSNDGGKTFSERPEWDSGNFQTSIALADDGTIDYITGHEASCGGGGQSRWRGNIADEKLKPGIWSMDAPISARATLTDFAYALDTSCGEYPVARLCAQGKNVVAVTLDEQADLGDGDLWSRPLGKQTLMLAGSALLLVDGTRAKVLSNAAPAEITAFSGTGTDAWVVSNGHVLHFDGKAWVR